MNCNHSYHSLGNTPCMETGQWNRIAFSKRNEALVLESGGLWRWLFGVRTTKCLGMKHGFFPHEGFGIMCFPYR